MDSTTFPFNEKPYLPSGQKSLSLQQTSSYPQHCLVQKGHPHLGQLLPEHSISNNHHHHQQHHHHLPRRSLVYDSLGSSYQFPIGQGRGRPKRDEGYSYLCYDARPVKDNIDPEKDDGGYSFTDKPATGDGEKSLKCACPSRFDVSPSKSNMLPWM